ncbi:MAG: 30S ribosome-binding factor RbfA [Kiritimatiellae bacterium]|nr:30S ribosome-binding factor RbfA [Kiritimatiellia bacterium]
MSVDRITRVNELLKREIGDLLFKVMHADEFDLASVTITRVATAKDLREARVYVSILGHEAERPHMLALLSRRHGEFQRRINKDITLKYTPRLTFELDTSVEEGDHVLAILAKLETSTPAS